MRSLSKYIAYINKISNVNYDRNSKKLWEEIKMKEELHKYFMKLDIKNRLLQIKK